jgi:hypothetical protein
MHIRAFIPAFLALLAAACGDSPVGSRAAAGYYRLESVNGQTLPYIAPPSLGFPPLAVQHGDLLLRGSGAFSLGIASIGGGYVTGRYRASGDELRLTAAPTEDGPSSFNVTGIAASDSVVIELGVAPWSHRYLFRRGERDPAPIAPGLYTLDAINDDDDAPFTRYDEVISGTRHVGHIQYDSIQFIDAVFYRQHLAESSMVESNGTLMTMSARERTLYGAYEGSANGVVLRPYWSFDDEDAATLIIDRGVLIRRTIISGVVTEERFVRRR